MTFGEWYESLGFRLSQTDTDEYARLEIAYNAGYKAGMERSLEFVMTKGPIPINIVEAIRKELEK